MMMCDHLNDIVGEMPFLGQGAPSLAVGKSHGGALRLVKRNLLVKGVLDCRAEFFGENQTVHWKPNIMEESRHVGLVVIGCGQLFAEFPAYHSATQRMPPENGGLQNPVVCREGLPQRTSKQYGLNAAET